MTEVTSVRTCYALKVHHAKEHIVMGKGLRFSNTVGEELVESHIEKVYVLKEENTKNYMNLLRVSGGNSR